MNVRHIVSRLYCISGLSCIQGHETCYLTYCNAFDVAINQQGMPDPAIEK